MPAFLLLTHPSIEFFKNVVQLAVDKCRSLRPSHLAMLWHEVALRAYGYLDLRKL